MYTLFFFWLVDEWNSVPCPVIRHETLRGKLTHPSQRQELESTGRFADQTKNSTSTKNVKKVLYVTVIYTTVINNGDTVQCLIN